MISKHGIVFERSYLSLLAHFPGKKKKINRNDLLTWKDYRESTRALFLPLGFCVGIASATFGSALFQSEHVSLVLFPLLRTAMNS